MQTESGHSPEQCVVVIGVGLIGGSIAAALKSRIPDCRVIGIGRDAERLNAARAAGLLDEFSTSVEANSIPSDSLIVVCLPVDQIAASVRSLTALTLSGSVITDAGSIKSPILRELAADTEAMLRFVGSHPIAGSEQTGWEHASPDLFINRVCVVTPESSMATNVDRVSAFWQSIGCEVRRMSAAEHDQMLARTSHLPHLMAIATTLCAHPDQLEFVGTGFRDTTRIAAGSPDIWTPILCGNSTYVADAIREAESVLATLRRAIESADASGLRSQLESAATLRRRLPRGGPR